MVSIKIDTDFWSQITDKSYWQVFLALVTAVAVAYSSHIFMQKRIRQGKLREAKSDFRRYGYELQQALSNRYQGEIFSNFYKILYRLTDDSDYLDQYKLEINKMPDQSLAVSIAYGKVYKTISLLEQLLASKKLSKSRRYLNKVIDYHLPEFSDGEDIMIIDDVLKYRNDLTKALAVWLDKNVKDNVNKAYAEIL